MFRLLIWEVSLLILESTSIWAGWLTTFAAPMPSFEDIVTGVQQGVTTLVWVYGPTLMLSYPGGFLEPFSKIFVSDTMIFCHYPGLWCSAGFFVFLFALLLFVDWWIVLLHTFCLIFLFSCGEWSFLCLEWYGLDYFFLVIKLFVVGVVDSVQMVGEFLCVSTWYSWVLVSIAWALSERLCFLGHPWKCSSLSWIVGLPLRSLLSVCRI